MKQKWRFTGAGADRADRFCEPDVLDVLSVWNVVFSVILDEFSHARKYSFVQVEPFSLPPFHIEVVDLLLVPETSNSGHSDSRE